MNLIYIVFHNENVILQSITEDIYVYTRLIARWSLQFISSIYLVQVL